MERRARSLDLLAYFREQPISFGLGQQSLVDAGARRIGVDGRWALTDRLTLTASGWRQTALTGPGLTGPGERIAGEARLAWRRNARTLFVGAQVASDRGGDSRLLTLGGSQALAGGALDLSGQTQLALGGTAAASAFPVRHQVTAGWRIARGVRLLAGYEIDRSATGTARTAQVGVDLSPWGGATLGGTLNRQAAEAGQRDVARYRLNQSLSFGARWAVDATLESAWVVNGVAPAGTGDPAFQPTAGGLRLDRDGGAFTAATLGATYRAPGWTATGRIEWRQATVERRWGVTASVLHPLAGGRTLAAGFRTGRVVDPQGRLFSDTTGDVALAWRPLASGWSVLDRLTLRRDAGDPGVLGGGASAVGGDRLTMRAVNDVAIQYRRRRARSAHRPAQPPRAGEVAGDRGRHGAGGACGADARLLRHRRFQADQRRAWPCARRSGDPAGRRRAERRGRRGCHRRAAGGRGVPAPVRGHAGPRKPPFASDLIRQGLAARTLRSRTNDRPIGSVTFSAGVAALAAGEGGEALLARADAAMYRAKDGGRNRVEIDRG